MTKKPRRHLRCRLLLCKWHTWDLPCRCGFGDLSHNCLKKARRRCLLCGRTMTLTISTMGDPVGEYYWTRADDPAPIPEAKVR